MKINSVNAIIGQYSTARTEPAYQRPQQTQAMDRVELSPEAKLFTEAFSAARRGLQQDGAAAARLEQIKAQMRSGDYRVEIHDICDKLLS